MDGLPAVRGAAVGRLGWMVRELVLLLFFGGKGWFGMVCLELLPGLLAEPAGSGVIGYGGWWCDCLAVCFKSEAVPMFCSDLPTFLSS